MTKEFVIMTDRGEFKEIVKHSRKDVKVIVNRKECELFTTGMKQAEFGDIRPGNPLTYSSGGGNALPVGKVEKLFKRIR